MMAMAWLTKLYSREKHKKYTNDLSELLDGNFFMMFIPMAPLFGGADAYQLKYSYSNLFRNSVCYREVYRYESFDTAYLLECLAHSKFITIELEEIGTLIFTNHRGMDLFQILQSHYRQLTSYVFCATDRAGYFKILQNGKISRKLASHLMAEGMGDCPETRGKAVRIRAQNRQSVQN